MQKCHHITLACGKLDLDNHDFGDWLGYIERIKRKDVKKKKKTDVWNHSKNKSAKLVLWGSCKGMLGAGECRICGRSENKSWPIRSLSTCQGSFLILFQIFSGTNLTIFLWKLHHMYHIWQCMLINMYICKIYIFSQNFI